ncbi:MAG TPA: EutN/CcmL family microcompartment protein [Planctomycetota bacterium]|nr:EutN/CcmL family microcompartment protein [Planctomycetota bacterium]
MKIGRVVGTVVTPVQHPAYDGRRLLAVRPLDPDGREAADRMFVAVDRAQAGVGDRVLLMAEGSSVRAIVGDDKAPIRCAVVGVIDEITVDGTVVYPAG